jgi:hypothetical protein
VTSVEVVRRRALARRRALVEAARDRTESFIEYALSDEESGRPLRNAPFHVEWQEFLRANRMAVLIAPIEHAKTLQIGVGKSLHMLGRNPSLRGAIISNTSALAEKVLRSVRTHIERNERVRDVFPTLRPSSRPEDPWHGTAITVERETIAKDPSLQALGAYGPVVGSRLDFIILDDLLDFENTRTEEQRTKLLEWFETTVLTRLAPGGVLYCIGTPWHPDDLLHILEKRPGFGARRYSAVLNPDEAPGHWKPLWPERWPVSRLRERAENTSDMVFARKYLCRVRMDATARFKQAWIERAIQLGRGLTLYPEAPKAQGGIRSLACFTGVDLGIGEREESALTVLFTIALRDDGRRLLVNVESGHWQAPEILDRLESHYLRYSSVIMVETNGAQRFIAQLAGERIPVQSWNTGANKWDEQFGVESLAVEFRNMQWVIPSGSGGDSVVPEVQSWIREMLYYSPTAHTGDRLMASWLAREALRLHSASRTQHLDTLSR